MIKAIAFDFDGVLVESTGVKTDAYARIFKNEDKEKVAQIVNYHLKFEGISRFEKFKVIYRDILKRSLCGEEFESLCLRFSRLVMDGVIASPWVEGAEGFLDKNKARYKYFIISGTPQEELREIVSLRGRENDFDEILGSPDNKEVLLNVVMAKYHLQPHELVFVGDAESDFVASQKTGVRFIWRRISGNASLLKDYDGPFIHSLARLEDFLQ